MKMMLFAEDLHEGMTLEAKFNKAPDPIWNDQYLPIRIEKEYPRWFLCTVLPHVNQKDGMGMSSEYPMTIDKFNLRIGEVVCRVA